MKPPAYRERTARELRQALRWAQRKLHLCDWEIELYLDVEALHHPLLAWMEKNEDRAVVSFQVGRIHAVMGICQGFCRKQETDPLSSLFHEMGHLVLNLSEQIDPKGHQYAFWEQSTNRIAGILFDLWQAEGRE